MSKISECSGPTAYCVMHKIVIAFALLTFIAALIALIVLAHRKRIPWCGGVAILLWLVALMNLLTFIHYSFVEVQYYRYTLGIREFFRGLIYISTFLFFGELLRQFTQWPYKLKLVVYISSGVVFIVLLAETISRFFMVTLDDQNICQETFWMAFKTVQFVVILFFLVVLVITQYSVNKVHLENVFDQIEFNKRKELIWRLWIIVGTEMFVTVFGFVYDIAVQIDPPENGNCDYPFKGVPSNAIFYIIFRIVTQFCVAWVIIFVLLLRQKERYPEMGATSAQYSYKHKSTDNMVPNAYGEVEFKKRKVDGSFLDQTGYVGLEDDLSD